MSAPSNRVDVVVGPRTRLGVELVTKLLGRGDTVVVLARDDADAQELSRTGAIVARPSDAASTVAALGPTSVRVHVCALGPVHPGPARFDIDAASVRRDLAVVSDVLEVPAASVHVVLISTVIALAPGSDRRNYGGWKCVVEQELRERVGAHPTAAFSVLYPGRLVGTASPLHAGYSRLAALAMTTAEGPSVGRAVGLDARLWLLLHGLRVALSAVFIAGTTSAERIDPSGSPHRNRPDDTDARGTRLPGQEIAS